MLAIQKARAAWRRAPRISLIGLMVMVLAGMLDVAVHLVAPDHAHGTDLALAHGAHLLGIAGMVLVLVGLVAFGTRRTRTRSRTGGSHMEVPRDAHR